MNRPLALSLSILVALAAAPAAHANKHHRVRHSHVPACAALVGAPCQAHLHNWRPDVARLALLKEIR